MKNEYIKYKNGESIDDDFKGNGLNTDLDAFKELAELGLKNIAESLHDKRVSNNDREIQLRAEFLNKIIFLIDEEQAAKIPSPPRIRRRSQRPSRRHRSVSPTQHTLGDGRDRSSGGKRTRKHKRSKHKRSKHKRKHKRSKKA